MEYKLKFELVPDSCWCSNLRSELPKEVWDGIRKKAYARAGGRCMICGCATGRLEAHEQWRYDDTTCVQSLENIIAICKPCHEVIHIGRTTLMGREREASEHFMKVNGCSYAEYRKALGEANAVHRERSRKDWQLDVSKLKDFM
ncbi:MAG: HNH endonuclease [Candidatus Coproplasma sp.]